MRRIIGGSAAFIAMTGTLLVLPVYASPAPTATPVETDIAEVALGSVTEPADEAVVTVDGESTDPSAATPSPTAEPSAEPTAGAEDAPEDAPEDGVATSGTEVPGVPALTVSQPDAGDFSAVGVTWTHDDAATDVVVQLRTRSGDGDWGAWETLETEASTAPVDGTVPDGVRDGTDPYWTGPRTGVEIIVQGLGERDPSDVSVQLIDPGTSAADAAPTAATVPASTAHAAATLPAYYSRAQWGADESIRTWNPEYAPTVKAATIHHTADSNNYTADQVPAMMRSIYAYHTQSREWGDIGYNVIVDKFGRIWEGRYGGIASTVIGAHAGGFNTGTFGVSMLGNYAETDTPQPMLDAVAAIVAWKLSLYGVDPRGTTQLTSGGGGTAKYAAGTVVTLPTIFAHRDVGNTTCPGQYAYNRMGQLRDMVTARMALAANSPNGDLNDVTAGQGVVTVRGWTFDPDAPTNAINVLITVGTSSVIVNAGGDRPDVAAYFPAAGRAHGYEATVGSAAGPTTVCATAINIGAGENRPLGCRTVTVKALSAQSYLRNSLTPGVADLTAVRGQAGDQVFRCDWDGNGSDTVGIYRAGTFYLYSTDSATAPIARRFTYGNGAGDTPVCGDWDGDGKDTIGIYRQGVFYVRNSNDSGIADGRIVFGNATAVPLVGNWNGDAYDTVGVYQNGSFYMTNSNTWPTTDATYRFGDGGDTPLVGDWTGSGRDSIGVWRAGVFYLAGNPASGRAETVVGYGGAGDRPLLGDWDGNGTDTLGVTRGY